ncbi:hypothetical protein VV02_07465 [Luteipulveratus mongoliensis]|uniref:Prepilin type IV endopeptidase peptidase domain-containing protein n=1 Tax=Luteipulveratus mongoliensis TaxID=571913 RepID=A0A0K1JPU8_9MICO|nr:hypothetical protein VV02_07465 [Luteipulveratus mongoliensis]
MWILVAVVGGALVGRTTSAWLARGSWRLTSESASAPTTFGWVVPAVAALWGVLAWRLSELDHGGAWPAYAALSVLGVALAAIDQQVHRLPDLLTLGGLVAVGLLLVLASVVESDWHAYSNGLWSAGLAFVAFAVLVIGGLGLGDLKLAVLLGLALGWLGLSVALVGLAGGFVLGGLWAVVLVARGASRSTRFAFGPWMLLGALVAILTVS